MSLKKDERRVVVVLVINSTMVIIEFGAGLAARSLELAVMGLV